jgi:hypothetical protein
MRMLSTYLKGSNFQVEKFIIAYSVVAYTVCILLTFMDKPSSVAITLFPLVANALYESRLLPGCPG